MRRYNRRLYNNLADRSWQRIIWGLSWFGTFINNFFRYGAPAFCGKKIKRIRRHEELVIIANGPSINQSIDEIRGHKNCDYCMMNYAPLKSELFEELKPSMLMCADVMLFDPDYKDAGKKQAAKELRKKLEEVDWDLNILTRRDMSFELKNKYVKEYRINTNQFGGVYSKIRGKLFDWDLAVPFTCTVAANAILAGIKLKYKKIYVYGIDNSTYEGVYVDERNRTKVRIRHFYSDGVEETLDQDNLFEITPLFFSIYANLTGYRMLEGYAKDRGVKVYNCSAQSIVDAFERFHPYKKQS